MSNYLTSLTDTARASIHLPEHIRTPDLRPGPGMAET